jgi:hypothetical protein
MTTTQRRIALLTGASLATLGVAVPAYAATVSSINHTGLTGASVNDTLTISNIGGTELVGFNETVTVPSGPLTASHGFPYVNQTANAAGNVILDIVNAGSARVGEFANLSASTGNITVNGVFGTGAGAINQVANGTGSLSLSLNNAGTASSPASLLAGASVNVAAAGGANATISVRGIAQSAAGGTSAQVSMTNADVLGAEALLNVNAGGAAVGNASLLTGYSQKASAVGPNGVASVSGSNAGTMSAVAQAVVVGSAATANASIGTAFLQNVAAASANASFTNVAGATQAFTASATASATTGNAIANARIDGIHQIAIGGTFASASYSNQGALDVIATANAHSPALAHAHASVSYGIEQTADVTGNGTANANVTNGGTISIAAIANAGGVLTASGATAAGSGATHASATAVVNRGIFQNVAVMGTGPASAGECAFAVAMTSRAPWLL